MAENGPFETPFLTPKIPPGKVYVGPFLHSFPGNEANKLSSGGPKSGGLGGGQQVYVEKVYVIFLSPALDTPHTYRFPTFGWGNSVTLVHSGVNPLVLRVYLKLQVLLQARLQVTH